MFEFLALMMFLFNTFILVKMYQRYIDSTEKQKEYEDEYIKALKGLNSGKGVKND